MYVYASVLLTLALVVGEWSVSSPYPFSSGKGAPGNHRIIDWVGCVWATSRVKILDPTVTIPTALSLLQNIVYVVV
jgi:hypothetical protein